MTPQNEDAIGDKDQSDESSHGENDDYATETVIPGHKLTVSVVKRPDATHPDEPYLAEFQPHRGARYTRRYSSAQEAKEDIDTAQRRSLIGFKESDRSMYD